MTSTNSASYLTDVHQRLNQYFNLQEIRDLCFKLNIDYETIPGDEKSSRIREMLLALGRCGRLPDLMKIVSQERPGEDWPPIPDDFRLPESVTVTGMSVPPDQYHVYGDMVRGDKIIGDKITGDKITMDQTIKENQGGFNANISGNAKFGDIQVNTTIINQQESTKEKKPQLPFEPEMVFIPAGPFVMGSEEPYEGGQSIIEIPDFYIGCYPITNREYGAFIQDTGRVVTPSLRWLGNRPSDNQLDWPVTGVTWYEALDYCLWLQGQTDRTYMLPSEAQWEKATRGTDGRYYPWGNVWQDDRCNISGQFVPVDTFEPQSPYGVFDLVGNGREWTTTLWGNSSVPDPRYRPPWQTDGRDDIKQPKIVHRIFKGGRQRELKGYRCSARAAFPPDQPGPKKNRIGFRVVRVT